MQAVAGLAISTLVIASIGVGIRLLVVHRRSHQAPELLLGLMLLLSVGLGYPLMIVSTRVDAETANRLLASSSLAVAVGFSCLMVFTWRVFRRNSAWGRAAALTGSGVLVGTAVWDAIYVLSHAGSHLAGGEVTPQSVIHAFTVMGAYLWASWESLHYRGMLKRRLRLGMADPVVCNRLLLWGLMGLAVSAGILLNVGAGVLGVSIVENPLVLLGSSTTGMTQTILLVLAFAPPRAYLGWVRGSVAAAPA